MRRAGLVGRWAGAALAALGLGGPAAADDKVAVGKPAPAFSMVGSDGQTYSSADLKGKKAYVIAWFPKAFTPGCTTQCKSLASLTAADLDPDKVLVFAASTDTAEKNASFAKSVGASFPILADPQGRAAKAFGVKTLIGVATRHTFFVDRDGVVRHIDTKVKTKDYGRAVVAKVKELKLDAAGG